MASGKKVTTNTENTFSNPNTYVAVKDQREKEEVLQHNFTSDQMDFGSVEL